jgi:hypothetical protein
MTSIELKKRVLEQISEIEDVSFLSTLNEILQSRVQSKKIKLSAELFNEILMSKKEIALGQYVEQKSLNKSFEQWQKEK